MSSTSPFVIEASSASFAKDAIERSAEVPVVVDFWAEWCGPCRLLGPRLERLADEFAGKFVVVKVDTERNPDLAQAFRIESIPAVYALRDREVVDSFVGALPEEALREWIERLLPTEVESLAAEALAAEATDPAAAEAGYRTALERHAAAPVAGRDPRGTEARLKMSLARVLTRAGKLDEAAGLIASLQARGFLEPEAERIRAELDLRTRGGAAGDVESCRAAVAANPTDRAAQLHLAEALAADGRHEEALEACLTLVEVDRSKTGEPARKLMIEIFQMLPDDSELVADFRRRLASALF